MSLFEIQRRRESIFGAHLLKRPSIGQSMSYSSKSWNSLYLWLTGSVKSFDRFGSFKTVNRTLHSPSISTSLASTLDMKEAVLEISQSARPLPYGIIVCIFSYLTPTQLAKCARLNRGLGLVALDADLWQIHCMRDAVPCRPGIEIIYERCNGDRGMWWKCIYLDWLVSKQHWRDGAHKKRMIALVEPEDAITRYVFITSLCFDVDQIVVGTRNNHIQLYNTHDASVWDSPSLPPTLRFCRHSHAITRIAFCENAGSVLVTGDTHGNLCFWNLMTGKLEAFKKQAHYKGISGLQMLTNDSVISVGFDGYVRIFEMEGLEDSLHDVAIVSENKTGNLLEKFWKRRRQKSKKKGVQMKHEIKAHDSDIYCLEVFLNKQLFATGSVDKMVKVWDARTLRVKLKLKGHSDIVTCLKAHTTGLFSGSLDKSIRKWDCDSGLCILILLGHVQWVKCIDVVDDILLSGGWDECVKMWSIADGLLLHDIHLGMGPITTMRCDRTKAVIVCREQGFQHQALILDFGRLL